MRRIENPAGVRSDFVPARRILEHIASELQPGASVLIMADRARSEIIAAALGPMRTDCSFVLGDRDGVHPEYEPDGRFTATILWGSLERCESPSVLIADALRLSAVSVIAVISLKPAEDELWAFEGLDLWRWFQKHEVRAHTVLARSFIVAAVNLRP